ncbi:ras guanine nucleotide exchange factor domain-containing protein [Sparassis latifolia]
MAVPPWPPRQGSTPRIMDWCLRAIVHRESVEQNAAASVPKSRRKSVLSRLRTFSLSCMLSELVSPLDVLNGRSTASAITLVEPSPVSIKSRQTSFRAKCGDTKNASYNSDITLDLEYIRQMLLSNASSDLHPEETMDVVRNADGSISLATFSELIHMATDQREFLKGYLADLVDVLFLYFRSFATPEKFFEMLLERYHGKAPSALGQEDLPRWNQDHNFSKVQVTSLIYMWLKFYWKPTTDECVRQRIIEFSHDSIASDTDIPLQLVKLVTSTICECSPGRTGHEGGRWLEKEITRTETAAGTFPPTDFQARLQYLETFGTDDTSLVNARYFLGTGGAEEIARHLTILESELFHTFVPEDLINFADRGLQSKLVAWRKFSDALSLWVRDCILEHSGAADRARLLEMFVTIAQDCKTMRNFSSAQIIVVALRSSCISRLQQTAKAVSQRCRDVYQELEEFFDSSKNWSPCRTELVQNLPAVPLAMIFVKDIIHCRDGLPRIMSTVGTSSKPSQEYIPLNYYRQMTKIVRGLEKCYGSYKLQRSEFLYGWLKHNIARLQQDSYSTHEGRLVQKSLLLEPKSLTPSLI